MGIGGLESAQAMAPMAQAQMGSGGQGDPSAARSQIIQALVQRMLSGQIQPKMGLPAPMPGAAYSPDKLKQEGYLMGNQGSKKGEIGAAMFNIGAAVKNAVAAHKEKQLRTAMSDWGTLQSRWENALSVSNGDQNKAQQIFENDPYTQGVLGDPKKMKNIAKVFQTDLMNPEKNQNTVYAEALKRHQQVNKAHNGFLGAIQKMNIFRNREPKLSPDQKKQMTHEMAGKLPFVAQPPDQKQLETITSLLQKQEEFEQREKDRQAQIAAQVERVQELIRHNKEQEDVAQQRLADAKTSHEDNVALRKAMIGISQQREELMELQTMLKAAGGK